MQAMREQESKEDIFFGQVAIIWARWFLIAGAAVVILMRPIETSVELVMGVLPLVALMGINFYLHGKYLMERPVGTGLIMMTSLLDLVLITTLVAAGPMGKGLDSALFLFYYPMVLAFAFVMPRRIEAAYTVLACAAYVLVCLPGILWADGLFAGWHSGVEIQEGMKTLFLRVLALAAMGGLGNYYWRIMRDRRRDAEEQRAAPMGAAE